MENLAKWMEMGTSMDLKGECLKTFIDEQQKIARDERAEQRELVALQLELEREKIGKRMMIREGVTGKLTLKCLNYLLLKTQMTWTPIYSDLKGMLPHRV